MGGPDDIRMYDSDCRIIPRLATAFDLPNGSRTLDQSVLLIVWGALVVSTIDNFLRPKLIKNQTKLHELFVFFSVLGGISVFLLLGLVLGPVILAITLGLLQTFRPQFREPVVSH